MAVPLEEHGVTTLRIFRSPDSRCSRLPHNWPTVLARGGTAIRSGKASRTSGTASVPRRRRRVGAQNRPWPFPPGLRYPMPQSVALPTPDSDLAHRELLQPYSRPPPHASFVSAFDPALDARAAAGSANPPGTGLDPGRNRLGPRLGVRSESGSAGLDAPVKEAALLPAPAPARGRPSPTATRAAIPCLPAPVAAAAAALTRIVRVVRGDGGEGHGPGRAEVLEQRQAQLRRLVGDLAGEGTGGERTGERKAPGDTATRPKNPALQPDETNRRDIVR